MDSMGQLLPSRSDKYWPRRLFHVGQGYSFPRQGRKEPSYGGVIRPAHATLSYTWRRFIQPGEASLAVQGILWKAPSIDPSHFNPAQLSRALHSVSSLCHYSFVWLDVACMDIAYPDYENEEVPMQREIFAGASHGFIWLCRTAPEKLNAAASFLEEASDLIRHSRADTRLAERAGALLVEILADPWFSSMWTLIEASVNPYSVLLSAAGSAAGVPSVDPPFSPTVAVEINEGRRTLFTTQQPRDTAGSKSYQANFLPSASGRYLTLYDLIWITDVAFGRTSFDQALSSTHTFSPSRKLADAVAKAGLLSIVPFNCLYLYQNIWHREEIQPGSRGALISSLIFDVPKESVPPKTIPYNTHIFDDAVAKEIVQRYPVLSQLYVRTVRDPAVSSFTLTRHCRIPDLEFYLTCFKALNPKYTVEKLASGCTKLQFTAPMSDFGGLVEKWTQGSCSGKTELIGIACDESRVLKKNGVDACLKYMEAMPTRTTVRGSATQRWELSESAKLDCLSQLCRELRGEDTRVLLIAHAPGSPCLAVGLVVVHRSDGAANRPDLWSRVAVVFWLCKEPALGAQESSPDLKLLLGPDWATCKGQMA